MDFKTQPLRLWIGINICHRGAPPSSGGNTLVFFRAKRKKTQIESLILCQKTPTAYAVGVFAPAETPPFAFSSPLW